ncbi:MAG: oxidoreductase C-terminal domain-containing protein, partial [Sphingomonadaceae bacterium]
KLQTVGLCGGHDRMVVRGAMDKRAFIAFYLREGKLIAADAVNRPQEFAAARQLMAKGLSPDPEVLADETRTMQDITQSALSERMDIL